MYKGFFLQGTESTHTLYLQYPGYWVYIYIVFTISRVLSLYIHYIYNTQGTGSTHTLYLQYPGYW